LSYWSTEHPSGREVDSGGGEEGEGKGSRDLEKEGGGPRAAKERVCVRRRRAGEVEYSSSSPTTARRRHRRGGGGSRSRDCKLRLRPAGADEGGGIRVRSGSRGGWGGVIYDDGGEALRGPGGGGVKRAVTGRPLMQAGPRAA
jgi:hypothetical protein